jgi:hypothetical protein
LTATSRLNDGTALLAATSISLLVLARKRKLLVTGLFVAVSLLILLAVVVCTGDSFYAYVTNTLTRAVGSKGGAGNMLMAPFHLFINAERMRHGIKWLVGAVVVLAAVGGLIQRFLKNSVFATLVSQVVIAPAAFAFALHREQQNLPENAFMDLAICAIVVTTYVLSAVVLVRLVVWVFSSGRPAWDACQILILFPMAQMASVSASSVGEPRSGYYAPMALFLLLVPVLQPHRKQVAWANATLLTVLIWASVVGVVFKERVPYFWDNIRGRPLFVDRQWYRHPVYGPMYIQTDLLRFSTSLCADMGGMESHPELLSLPFPYPNYFCDSPPWHGYVQTFIDITARSTMHKLMAELQAAPPQWIVYQRQMGSLFVLERSFNHGRPSPQRDLDALIMQRIRTGQWKVIDFKPSQYGDGWYVIRTRP